MSTASVGVILILVGLGLLGFGFYMLVLSSSGMHLS
jgi:hypothetical protein